MEGTSEGAGLCVPIGKGDEKAPGASVRGLYLLVRREGVEPSTLGLRVPCSTN